MHDAHVILLFDTFKNDILIYSVTSYDTAHLNSVGTQVTLEWTYKYSHVCTVAHRKSHNLAMYKY